MYSKISDLQSDQTVNTERFSFPCAFTTLFTRRLKVGVDSIIFLKLQPWIPNCHIYKLLNQELLRKQNNSMLWSPSSSQATAWQRNDCVFLIFVRSSRTHTLWIRENKYNKSPVLLLKIASSYLKDTIYCFLFYNFEVNLKDLDIC